MKTFEYKGFAADGQTRRGLVEALNVKEARERLVADGVLAERVVPTGRSQAFRIEQRTMIYRELGALLVAGVPMVRAFEMLIQASRQTTPGALLAGVRDRVREGAGLADALGDGASSVTDFERAVIRAGERSGAVAAVLTRLSDFLEDQEQLRDRVRRALIYPAVVVVVGLCVAGVMLGLLVPRAEALLGSSGQPLPGLTRAMLALVDFGARWGGLVLVMLAALGVLFARRYATDAAMRLRWDRTRFRLPLWGAGYGLLCSLRFARTMAMLLRGGVPLVEGVALAGRATGSDWLAHLAEQQAEAVRHGGRLSDAVARMPPLAGALPGWIQVGEESGDLAGLLEHAGNRYAEQWDRYVSRVLALLEPALLLAIGAFVLLITLAVLLPVLSLSESVTL